MLSLIDFYKEIFLHVIPVCIIVACCYLLGTKYKASFNNQTLLSMKTMYVRLIFVEKIFWLKPRLRPRGLNPRWLKNGE